MKQAIITVEKEEPLIKSDNQFPVVGVGASAGGFAAFKTFLGAIPKDSGMAYVLVQHLDPNHESLLAELLQKSTELPVIEITDNLKVIHDQVYILPSNKMLIANDGILALTPRTTKKGVTNKPVDLFINLWRLSTKATRLGWYYRARPMTARWA